MVEVVVVEVVVVVVEVVRKESSTILATLDIVVSPFFPFLSTARTRK